MNRRAFLRNVLKAGLGAAVAKAMPPQLGAASHWPVRYPRPQAVFSTTMSRYQREAAARIVQRTPLIAYLFDVDNPSEGELFAPGLTDPDSSG